MEERLYNLLKSERAALRAILEYFSLKNKVLWEGTWESGSVTVKGISKYKTLQITVNGSHCIASVKDGNVIAIAFEKNQWGVYSKHFTGTISGDKLTVVECYYMAHVPSSNHGATTATSISKIVGIDPILPDALQNIIGGGYGKLGGGAVATVQSLKGYYSYHKKHLEQVLSRIGECYRYIQDIVHGVLAHGFAERRVSRFGAYCRKCGRKLIYPKRCLVREPDCVGAGAKPYERRRRSAYMGLTVGRGCGHKLCAPHDISLLLGLDNIHRKDYRYPSDLITDWGCAA